MPVAGVDVGSVAAKAVIFDPQSRSLLGKAVLPTGWNAREAGEKALAAAHPDAVYLLHPMATNSAMLGELIDGLRAAGYTLAAL